MHSRVSTTISMVMMNNPMFCHLKLTRRALDVFWNFLHLLICRMQTSFHRMYMNFPVLSWINRSSLCSRMPCVVAHDLSYVTWPMCSFNRHFQEIQNLEILIFHHNKPLNTHHTYVGKSSGFKCRLWSLWRPCIWLPWQPQQWVVLTLNHTFCKVGMCF